MREDIYSENIAFVNRETVARYTRNMNAPLYEEADASARSGITSILPVYCIVETMNEKRICKLGLEPSLSYGNNIRAMRRKKAMKKITFVDNGAAIE